MHRQSIQVVSFSGWLCLLCSAANPIVWADVALPGRGGEETREESRHVGSGKTGDAIGDPVIEGTRCAWHPIAITFRGPTAGETDDQPNPFLDYRLQVAFRGPSGQVYNVPGFFDGDGRGGPRGDVWRVRFAADEAGSWRFVASFRQGKAISLSLDPAAGEAGGCDGQAGQFDVAPRDPNASGFLKWGRLQYVGQHYLKFTDGPYWIRGGTDEPENLLAFAGFDNTPDSHRFAAHLDDWRAGDPDWGDGRGRAIIGALNYLAARHVNSIYFLTMNIGGDGKDVWPWTGTPARSGSPQNDNLHFDLSKLQQWNSVFDHAQRLGLFLHFVLNEAEAENKKELDEGELGTERKLYYREIVARFGHHPALEWNLCEEYNLQFDFGPERVRQFARFVADVDPYDHPLTVHSAGDPLKMLQFTFGDPLFSLTSIQLNQRRIDTLVEAFREATRATGRPLPISMDEFTVDKGQERSSQPVDDAELWRKQKLWPTYLSGGMLEFILGDLLETESFRTPEREKLWNYTWYARRFMQDELPFWQMEPADHLVQHAGTLAVGMGKGKTFDLGPQVFVLPGRVYAVYLPKASPSGSLDLREAQGPFQQRWYDPRRGQFVGEARLVSGGREVALGAPPSDIEDDWVVLIRSAKPE